MAVGRDGTDAPICQDTHSGSVCDVSTSAEVCHDALVDLAREETFEAPDDLTFGVATTPGPFTDPPKYDSIPMNRDLGLIRFGGHLPKGEYDVDHGGHEGQAGAAELHG